MTGKPPTPEDGKRFIDQAFRDRISWTAARILLERVNDDVFRLGTVEPGTLDAIARFLERNQAGPVAVTTDVTVNPTGEGDPSA